jgi:hypothetical protein
MCGKEPGNSAFHAPTEEQRSKATSIGFMADRCLMQGLGPMALAIRKYGLQEIMTRDFWRAWSRNKGNNGNKAQDSEMT